jgi:hypothetical protein
MAGQPQDVMAKLRKVAMTRGALAVRIWERSSS